MVCALLCFSFLLVRPSLQLCSAPLDIWAPHHGTAMSRTGRTGGDWNALGNGSFPLGNVTGSTEEITRFGTAYLTALSSEPARTMRCQLPYK